MDTPQTDKTTKTAITTDKTPIESGYKQEYKQEYKQDYLQETTVLPPSPNTNHIKISVRLQKGIVTSFTIKKNIIALWVLYTSDTDYLDIYSLLEQRLDQRLDPEELTKFSNKLQKLINDFVYKCLDKWGKDTGKGLSDFITEKMIEDFLDTEDYTLYTSLLLTINS